jgi:urease accessory protein
MQRLLLIFPLVALAATPALAHIGVGHTHSFSAGFGHPLGGLDHILAMVTVGLWGAVAGGRALWAWPAAFVGAMIAGFAAASSGVALPFVEPAILASSIVLGLLVMLAVRAPVGAGALVVGTFALFHGHAHGTEAAGASLIPYAAGFAIATATLHMSGILLGLSADGRRGHFALRGAGAAACLGGVALVAGLL